MSQDGSIAFGETDGSNPAPEPFTWESRDGLRLAGRQWYPSSASPHAHPTVLCLSGLSRNTRDFNEVARFLQNRNYRVVALDYRGRGDSAWDPDWQNYAIPVEAHDIDDAIAKLQLKRFAVLGTSRGGLHAMAMAERYSSDQFCGAILNDIGPHLEMKAIHRIAAAIGKTMTFPNHDALAKTLAHSLGDQFSAFSQQDWLKFAHQLASSRDGACILDYDPALGHALAAWDDAAPLPDVWHLFEAMEKIPVLILRGEKSDLLSAETCQQMLARHPRAELATVTGQGHAPVLWDEQTQTAIANFLDRLAV